MKALILSLIFSLSCTRSAQVERNSMEVVVTEINMNISHLVENKWPIGKRRNHVVSQSFSFMVSMPRLSKDDLQYLQQRSGADAWLIRLIKIKGSQRDELGSLYALFRPRQVSRNISWGAASQVSLKVYYAAAFPSQRFRALTCPAFGHNKRITQLSLRGDDHPLDIKLGQTTSFREKPQMVELAASSFNAGHDLAGEYHLEIAAYHSQRKELVSAFKRIPEHILIQEERVSIGDCSGEFPI